MFSNALFYPRTRAHLGFSVHAIFPDARLDLLHNEAFRDIALFFVNGRRPTKKKKKSSALRDRELCFMRWLGRNPERQP